MCNLSYCINDTFHQCLALRLFLYVRQEDIALNKRCSSREPSKVKLKRTRTKASLVEVTGYWALNVHDAGEQKEPMPRVVTRLWRPEFIPPNSNGDAGGTSGPQPLGGTVGVTKWGVHFSDTERCSGLRLFPKAPHLERKPPNIEVGGQVSRTLAQLQTRAVCFHWI